MILGVWAVFWIAFLTYIMLDDPSRSRTAKDSPMFDRDIDF